MDTQKDQQQQIDDLSALVKALRRDVDLIAKVLSRHGLNDIRITKHALEILDRLHKLDGKES